MDDSYRSHELFRVTEIAPSDGPTSERLLTDFIVNGIVGGTVGMTDTTPSRRRLLQMSCATFAVGFAGCTGIPSRDEERGSSERENEAETEPEPETETDEPDGTDDEPADAETDEPGEESDPEFDIEDPPGVYADVPIPDEPRSFEYPIAGTGDASVRVRLFGGWKCRHTRRFVLGFFEDIVDDYVRTGSIDVEFHGVAYRNGETLHGDDGPRTARTGLAVWHNQPELFWSYLEFVYTNVEREDGWATPDRLGAIAAEAGFEAPDALAGIVESDAFEPQLEETVEVAERLSVTDVPRLEIQGEVYAPNLEPEETRGALEAAVDGTRTDGSAGTDEEDQDGADSDDEAATETGETGDENGTDADGASTDADEELGDDTGENGTEEADERDGTDDEADQTVTDE